MMYLMHPIRNILAPLVILLYVNYLKNHSPVLDPVMVFNDTNLS